MCRITDLPIELRIVFFGLKARGYEAGILMPAFKAQCLVLCDGPIIMAKGDSIIVRSRQGIWKFKDADEALAHLG